jgi:hypothetical protein
MCPVLATIPNKKRPSAIAEGHKGHVAKTNGSTINAWGSAIGRAHICSANQIRVLW